MGKNKVPDRLAVMVQDRSNMQCGSGSNIHDTIYASDGRQFLLRHGTMIPEPGDLVILRNTRERPVWWEGVRKEKMRGDFFGYHKTPGSMYLWEVEDGEAADHNR